MTSILASCLLWPSDCTHGFDSVCSVQVTGAFVLIISDSSPALVRRLQEGESKWSTAEAKCVPDTEDQEGSAPWVPWLTLQNLLQNRAPCVHVLLITGSGCSNCRDLFFDAVCYSRFDFKKIELFKSVYASERFFLSIKWYHDDNFEINVGFYKHLEKIDIQILTKVAFAKVHKIQKLLFQDAHKVHKVQKLKFKAQQPSLSSRVLTVAPCACCVNLYVCMYNVRILRIFP